MGDQNKQSPWDSPIRWWIPNPLPSQPINHSGYGWIAIKHVFRSVGAFRLKIRVQNAAFCKCQDNVHFLKHGPGTGRSMEYFFLYNPAWGRTADTGCSARQEGCSYLWDQPDRCGNIATGRPGTAAVHFAIHFGQMGMLLDAERLSRSTSTFESRLNSPLSLDNSSLRLTLRHDSNYQIGSKRSVSLLEQRCQRTHPTVQFRLQNPRYRSRRGRRCDLKSH